MHTILVEESFIKAMLSMWRVWPLCAETRATDKVTFKVRDLRSKFSVGPNPERYDKTGCTSQMV